MFHYIIVFAKNFVVLSILLLAGISLCDAAHFIVTISNSKQVGKFDKGNADRLIAKASADLLFGNLPVPVGKPYPKFDPVKDQLSLIVGGMTPSRNCKSAEHKSYGWSEFLTFFEVNINTFNSVESVQNNVENTLSGLRAGGCLFKSEYSLPVSVRYASLPYASSLLDTNVKVDDVHLFIIDRQITAYSPHDEIRKAYSNKPHQIDEATRFIDSIKDRLEIQDKWSVMWDRATKSWGQFRGDGFPLTVQYFMVTQSSRNISGINLNHLEPLRYYAMDGSIHLAPGSDATKIVLPFNRVYGSASFSAEFIGAHPGGIKKRIGDVVTIELPKGCELPSCNLSENSAEIGLKPLMVRAGISYPPNSKPENISLLLRLISHERVAPPYRHFESSPYKEISLTIESDETIPERRWIFMQIDPSMTLDGNKLVSLAQAGEKLDVAAAKAKIEKVRDNKAFAYEVFLIAFFGVLVVGAGYFIRRNASAFDLELDLKAVNNNTSVSLGSGDTLEIATLNMFNRRGKSKKFIGKREVTVKMEVVVPEGWTVTNDKLVHFKQFQGVAADGLTFVGEIADNVALDLVLDAGNIQDCVEPVGKIQVKVTGSWWNGKKEEITQKTVPLEIILIPYEPMSVGSCEYFPDPECLVKGVATIEYKPQNMVTIGRILIKLPDGKLPQLIKPTIVEPSVIATKAGDNIPLDKNIFRITPKTLELSADHPIGETTLCLDCSKYGISPPISGFVDYDLLVRAGDLHQNFRVRVTAGGKIAFEVKITCLNAGESEPITLNLGEESDTPWRDSRDSRRVLIDNIFALEKVHEVLCSRERLNEVPLMNITILPKDGINLQNYHGKISVSSSVEWPGNVVKTAVEGNASKIVGVTIGADFASALEKEWNGVLDFRAGVLANVLLTPKSGTRLDQRGNLTVSISVSIESNDLNDRFTRSLVLKAGVRLVTLNPKSWLCIDFGTSAIAAVFTPSFNAALKKYETLDLQHVHSDSDRRNLAEFDQRNPEFGNHFLPSWIALIPAKGAFGDALPGSPAYQKKRSDVSGTPGYVSLPAVQDHLSSSPDKIVVSVKAWLGSPMSEIVF